MAVRRWRIGILGCLLGMAPLAALADPAQGGKLAEALHAGQSRLHDLLARHITFVDCDGPEWIVQTSHDELDPGLRAGDTAAQLVLQRDRRDGADLLTLRRPLLALGALRAYAGAGLNRATSFAPGDDEPVLLSHRRRQSSIGAAAELGAEFRIGGQLMVIADLRWAGLAESADLLRGVDGPVGADPVVAGLAVGWRFH